MMAWISLADAPRALHQANGGLFSSGMEAANLGVQYGNFKQGDERVLRARLKFIRTERGWMLEAEE